MSYDVRRVQARCASLGFWPGPIDGVPGPRSRAAEAAARASQAKRGLPFIHPSGLTRIHFHWTAGGHTANADDRRAYHILIEGGGLVIQIAPCDAPRSHTLNANGGAVGISMCAMAGAVERPFSAGKSPVSSAQIGALAREAARLCIAYDIPVSRWSTLSHAEIQPSLGIKQRNKWDICWLPGMSGPADPVTVGDRIRELVRAEITSQKGA